MSDNIKAVAILVIGFLILIGMISTCTIHQQKAILECIKAGKHSLECQKAIRL